MGLFIPSLIVIGIVGASIFTLLGSYLNDRIGRPKLTMYGVVTILSVIIIFAVYAVIYALVLR
jgi:hypothetical protein